MTLTELRKELAIFADLVASTGGDSDDAEILIRVDHGNPVVLEAVHRHEGRAIRIQSRLN